METFQCDVVQVCPSPDDELAFAAYAITLHDHFIGGRGSAHLAGAKQCNISSVRAERVRYLARPDWERTAALYTNFAQAAAIGVQHWDLTALCACIENCAAFKCCPGCTARPHTCEESCVRLLNADLRDVRNGVAHKNTIDTDYHAAMDVIEETLVKLGVAEVEAKATLEPYRDGMNRDMPASDSLEEADQYDKQQRAGVAKLLTASQMAGFRDLRRAPAAGQRVRRLLEAPAGSGKTLVAVKLVAEHLCAVDAAGQGDAALLLVHSRSLQRHVLRELCAELLGELGREAGLEWVREGVARLELRRGAVAIVASVDDLSGELVGGAAQTKEEVAAAVGAYTGAIALGSVGLAVVDEGHHVFGRQPDARLVGLPGQRRFEHPAKTQTAGESSGTRCPPPHSGRSEDSHRAL